MLRPFALAAALLVVFTGCDSAAPGPPPVPSRLDGLIAQGWELESLQGSAPAGRYTLLFGGVAEAYSSGEWQSFSGALSGVAGCASYAGSFRYTEGDALMTGLGLSVDEVDLSGCDGDAADDAYFGVLPYLSTWENEGGRLTLGGGTLIFRAL